MYMPPKVLKTIACACKNSAPSFVSQCVSQSAMSMPFARSATLGKQRRRNGRGSCGETDQAQESAEAKVACWYAQPASQKPQCAPSNGPTERRQPTSITALSQALSVLVFAELILSYRASHSLLPLHQGLGLGQTDGDLRECKRRPCLPCLRRRSSCCHWSP